MSVLTLIKEHPLAMLDITNTVGIISHVDLDGVASAVIVSEAIKALDGNDPSVRFIGYSRGIGDRIVKEFDGKGYDFVFITDISLRNNEKGVADLDLVIDMVQRNPHTQFFWYDHHKSSQPELVPKGLDNFHYSVETREDVYKCGADVTYEALWGEYNLKDSDYAQRRLDKESKRILDYTRRLRDLAHDYDISKPDGKWRKDIPDSIDMSDAIAKLGPVTVYNVLKDQLYLVEDYKFDELLWDAIKKQRKEREASLELVRRTQKELTTGKQKIKLAACCGSSSEAGHLLAGDDKDAAAIVLDIHSHEGSGGFRPSLSLRRADGSTVNLEELGKKLGGGGHDYAAGGRIDPLRLITAMLNETEKYIQENLN